jgi:hypothetical protein
MFPNPKITFSRRPLLPLPLLSAYLSPLSASFLFDFSPLSLLSINLKLQAYFFYRPTYRKMPQLFDRRSFKCALQE